MLAQALYPSDAPIYPKTGEEAEAAAANKAWSTLTRDVTSETGASDPSLKNALKKSLELSMQTFTDLLVQIEEMDSEPSLDTYAWETMSESLVSFSPLARSIPHNKLLLETWDCLCCRAPWPGQQSLFAPQGYYQHRLSNCR
jgi:hypothetical protein